MKAKAKYNWDFNSLVFYINKTRFAVGKTSHWKIFILTENDLTLRINKDEYFGSSAHLIPVRENRLRRQDYEA
jgi:hypothetical protein